MPRKKKRTFAVFFDYTNIIDRFHRNDQNRNIDQLLKTVLEQGEIIFAFVFVPEHLRHQAPVMQLHHDHRFTIVDCPRQIEGYITKDKDSVDAIMDSMARKFIEHSDVTDIAIFSGDADFIDVATYAFWRKKRVTVIANQNSISGRFLQMAEDKKIEVVTV